MIGDITLWLMDFTTNMNKKNPGNGLLRGIH